MNIGEMIERLEIPMKAPLGYKARCPAHFDEERSLSIVEVSEDQVMLSCSSGCSLESITSALGYKPGELRSLGMKGSAESPCDGQQKKKPFDNSRLSKGPSVPSLTLEYDYTETAIKGQEIFNAFSPYDVDLADSDDDRPKFPLGALPKEVGEFCASVAKSTETNIEMSATVCLGTLAALLQIKHFVRVKPGYRENLSLYTIIAADSGERKSAVFSNVVKPARDVVREYNKSNEAEFSDSEIELKSLKDRADFLEKSIAALSRDAPKRKELLKELKMLKLDVKNFEETKNLEIFSDDITVEKASDLLINNGALAIASAESGFFGNLRRYDSANIDPFLKGYSGDSLIVQRIGRPGGEVDNPRISMILAAQPIIVKQMFADAEFHQRGLCARFLIAFCGSTLSQMTFNADPVPESAVKAWKDDLHRILTEEDDEEISLSAEACEVYREFGIYSYSQLGKSGALAGIKFWVSKLPGQMLRIAGVIHCCENKFPSKTEISKDTMLSARAIAEYYLKNALRASCGDDDSNSNNERIFNQILMVKSTSPNGEVNKRHLARKFHIDNNELQNALDDLVEHGYICVTEKKNKTGRNSTIILVNPLAEKNENAEQATDIQRSAPIAAPAIADAAIASHRNFVDFLNVYPRKDDRANAHKEYEARLADGFSPDELLTAAQAYAADCAKTDTKFIKKAKTFLGESLIFMDYLKSASAEGAQAKPEDEYEAENRRLCEELFGRRTQEREI
jgi:hypothetical protein